jgi:hypothetical protein
VDYATTLKVSGMEHVQDDETHGVTMRGGLGNRTASSGSLKRGGTVMRDSVAESVDAAINTSGASLLQGGDKAA